VPLVLEVPKNMRTAAQTAHLVDFGGNVGARMEIALLEDLEDIEILNPGAFNVLEKGALVSHRLGASVRGWL
jgi:hypothetical protein